MVSKKILGTLILGLGVIALGVSMYIRSQVEAGEKKISSAQRKLDQSNTLFNLNPVTKEIGKGISGGVQKKIDRGIDEVNEYDRLAGLLKIGGIVFIIVGAGVLILNKK